MSSSNTTQNSLVVLSWTQYRNEVIDLTQVKVTDLPPNLRQIAALLQNAAGPLRNTDLK